MSHISTRAIIALRTRCGTQTTSKTCSSVRLLEAGGATASWQQSRTKIHAVSLLQSSASSATWLASSQSRTGDSVRRANVNNMETPQSLQRSELPKLVKGESAAEPEHSISYYHGQRVLPSYPPINHTNADNDEEGRVHRLFGAGLRATFIRHGGV